jgi:hypothetical protein
MLAGLVVKGNISPYPWLAMGAFGLFIVNFLIVRKARWPRVQVSSRLVKTLWLITAAYTIAGISTIVVWYRTPDLPHTLQGVFSILFVGYLWFLLYVLRHRGGA